MSTARAWMPGTITPDRRDMTSCAEERANYREMAATPARTAVDLTIPAMMMESKSANFALSTAQEIDLPVWTGLNCSRLREGELVGWNRTAEPTNGSIDPSVLPDILLEFLVDELTGSYPPTVEHIDRMVAQLPVEPGRHH